MELREMIGARIVEVQLLIGGCARCGRHEIRGSDRA